MSYEFGFILSLARLKFLRLWFVRHDTERMPPNYTTCVNGVKFFRAGVCTPTRGCAREREARPKTACQFVAVRLLFDRVHADRQVKHATGVGVDGDRIVGGSR